MNDRPEYPDQLALTDLAFRIGAELDFLMHLSLTVQSALSHCICTHPADAETLKGLQGIDRITQGLADVARLMADIGDTAPGGVFLGRHALERRLQLRDLCQRIFLPDAAVGQPDGRVSAGEVTLF